MKLKVFLFSLLMGVSITHVSSQSNMSISSKQSKPFDFSFGDTASYISIMDNYKIDQLMDSLSSTKRCEECMNMLAIDVMKSRLSLLEDISRKYYARNTMNNIRCILHNFHCLTGIKPEGDHDFFGTTFISLHTILQYEEWLKANKDRLCIDKKTRILFVPRE